jgi:hypothetical protein
MVHAFVYKQIDVDYIPELGLSPRNFRNHKSGADDICLIIVHTLIVY